MKRSIFFSSSAVLVALVGASTSCSSESDDTSNTAGSGGKGGSAGTGFAGTGGGSGASGSAGKGGSSGVGGVSGSGGTSGKGGSGGALDCPQGTLFGKDCMEIRTEFQGKLSPCDLCLTSTCCTEFDACFSNQSCAGLNECLNTRCFNLGGAARTMCEEQQCGACLADPSVRTIVTNFRNCAMTKCAAECVGGDAGAPRPDAGASDSGGGG